MNDGSKVLLQPTVKYQNYQISCSLKDKTMVYDSSFVGDERTFRSSVAVGADGNMFSVSAFVQGDVMACTLLTYNKILLNVKFSLFRTITKCSLWFHLVSTGKILLRTLYL